jgi:hypothetical protein
MVPLTENPAYEVYRQGTVKARAANQSILGSDDKRLMASVSEVVE